MRKVTYSDVQTKVQRLMGVDTLLTSEQNSILNAVNKYMRLAWERAAWPEVTDTQQRGVNGRVGSVTIDSSGASYTSAPAIAFSSGGTHVENVLRKSLAYKHENWPHIFT